MPAMMTEQHPRTEYRDQYLERPRLARPQHLQQIAHERIGFGGDAGVNAVVREHGVGGTAQDQHHCSHDPDVARAIDVAWHLLGHAARAIAAAPQKIWIQKSRGMRSAIFWRSTLLRRVHLASLPCPRPPALSRSKFQGTRSATVPHTTRTGPDNLAVLPLARELGGLA